MNKRVLYCILFLLQISVALSWAQSPKGEIIGKVVDKETSEAIPYVTVEVFRVEPPFKEGVVSNQEGVFRSAIAPYGKYTLKIRCLGYTPYIQEIEIGENPLHLGTIHLQKTAVELSDVTVVARRKLIKLSPVGLTYDLKNDKVAQTDNLLFALRRVPLVDVDGEGNIRIKGSYNFSIYLNGSPYRIASMNPKEVLRSIPANTIKKVEVITQLDARYDSSAGDAILNIITDRKTLDGYSGSITLGGETAHRGDVSTSLLLTKGRLSTAIAYDYRYDKQIDQPIEFYRRTFQGGETINEFKANESKGYGLFQFHTGRLMAEYQIDSLNSIYADGHFLFSSLLSEGERWQTFRQKGEQTRYSRFNQKMDKVDGSSEFNLIYRNLFPSKESERFTIGYRFAYNPDHRYEDVTEQKSLEEFSSWDRITPQETRIKQLSRGGLSEHTLQSDYVVRLAPEHTLRIGAKDILRIAEARPEYYKWDYAQKDWKEDDNPLYQYGNMKQLQNIVATYASYSWQHNRWGANLGIRGEYAFNTVTFEKEQARNFKTQHLDLIPTFKLSFLPSNLHQISLFYSARTLRPSIWSLNPFRQQTNDFNVSFGNPNLKSERNHYIDLSYTHFSNSYYINAGFNYSHTNNAIMEYRFRDPNNPSLLCTTYGNIGIHRVPSFSLWTNWRPIPTLSLSLYGAAAKHLIDSQMDSYKQRTWNFVFSAWGDITLPKQWIIGANYNVNANPPSVGSVYSYGHHYKLFVKKRLWDKKLDLTLTLDRIFERYSHLMHRFWGADFEGYQSNHIIARSIGLKISYNFSSGESRKVERNRSIQNEDLNVTTGVQ